MKKNHFHVSVLIFTLALFAALSVCTSFYLLHADDDTVSLHLLEIGNVNSLSVPTIMVLRNIYEGNFIEGTGIAIIRNDTKKDVNFQYWGATSWFIVIQHKNGTEERLSFGGEPDGAYDRFSGLFPISDLCVSSKSMSAFIIGLDNSHPVNLERMPMSDDFCNVYIEYKGAQRTLRSNTIPFVCRQKHE